MPKKKRIKKVKIERPRIVYESSEPKFFKIFKVTKILFNKIKHKIKENKIGLENVWSFILVIIVIVNLIILPFRSSFLIYWNVNENSKNYEPFSGFFSFISLPFDVFIDIIYLLDIFLNLFIFGIITKRDQDNLSSNDTSSSSTSKNPKIFRKLFSFISKRVSFSYVKSFFFVDVIAIIPLDIISFIFYDSLFAGNFYSLFRMNRLIKSVKINFYFSKIQQLLKDMNQSAKRLIEFVIVIALVIHIFSCIYFFIILLQNDKSSTLVPGGVNMLEMNVFQQYIRSFYWAFITITGYYNSTPKSNTELILSMTVSFLGIIIYIGIIGSVGSLYSEIDVTSSVFQMKMDEINEFFRFRKIGTKLANKVRDYYAHMWKTRKTINEQETLEDLPINLRIETMNALNQEMLAKVKFMLDKNGNLNQQFMNAVVLKMQPLLAPPDSYIIKSGQIGKEMYFISKGQVQVIVGEGKDQKVVATLKTGSSFGEVAILLKNTKRTASIRSVSYTDLYVIKKDDFINVLEHFPEQKKIVKELAEERKAAALKAKIEESRKKKIKKNLKLGIKMKKTQNKNRFLNSFLHKRSMLSSRNSPIGTPKHRQSWRNIFMSQGTRKSLIRDVNDTFVDEELKVKTPSPMRSRSADFRNRGSKTSDNRRLKKLFKPSPNSSSKKIKNIFLKQDSFNGLKRIFTPRTSRTKVEKFVTTIDSP